MSSSNRNIYASRQWMYRRKDPISGAFTEEFVAGVRQFIDFAQMQPLCIESGKTFCPCVKCKNGKLTKITTVCNHLYSRGFVNDYYVWFFHGEDPELYTDNFEINVPPTTSTAYEEPAVISDQGIGYEASTFENPYVPVEFGGFHPGGFEQTTGEEMPNLEAKRFFDLLESSNQPIYEGCQEGHSRFSLAARMLHTKTDYNVAEQCMDSFCQTMHDYLPQPNNASKSYYETKSTVRQLGMPRVKIDVCPNNCMLFWGADEKLKQCKFCDHNRYRTRNAASRKLTPYKKMFYLPLSNRLKRLYESSKTAPHMTWHAEHSSKRGEMQHPSDGEAWKDFNRQFPNFAAEPRNVYLCLCTDGFAPYGKSGSQYSLWPVIMSPYNLPPEMCLKREVMFLTLLIPGPDHPKKSFDVFLQPLIKELTDLWNNGVTAWDVCRRQNFTLKAVLLWTISDFPAYGMLSGWSTHGRLACPYCMDETDAFRLEHGRKPCWFDCHRRFLPPKHRFRGEKNSFRRDTTVRRAVPQNPLTGDQIYYERISSVQDLQESVRCGGNFGHRNPHGFGDFHNWYKRSIFWDLPYWSRLSLRHNLDVMHIEKNFFENIINTVLHVPGKTKDTVNSRKDLESVCRRPDLELRNGKAPVPVYRVLPQGRNALMKWLKDDLKFPDGYASKIGRCVDLHSGKLQGMKSHDCHVFMERLIPIAFAELLPPTVHLPLCGISNFFRDLCAKNLQTADVEFLERTIPEIICALEKVFVPSFFDVMEHLPVHLPYEALQGGPVQFRWMYPFERMFFHLKKKAKNQAHPEGSIINQFVLEEISYFTEFYFEPDVQTKGRRSSKTSNFEYLYQYSPMSGAVPTIFLPTGRLSGRPQDYWLETAEYEILHTYILLNCEELHPFERIYDEELIQRYPDEMPQRLQERKERGYSVWLNNFVHSRTTAFSHPAWLMDLCEGPNRKVVSYPIMFTRGYTFHTYDHGTNRNSYNYGVCVKGATYSESSDDPDFYGMLYNIFEIQYPGATQLKTIIFKCGWYDTSERGLRKTRWGGVEINPARAYPKNDPFILSSQADQVCFLPYPSNKRRREDWYAVVNIKPRGLVPTEDIQEVDEPLQAENAEPVMPLLLEDVDRLAQHDIDGEFVRESDQIVHDAEREDEFETSSPEDDSTSTDRESEF